MQGGSKVAPPQSYKTPASPFNFSNSHTKTKNRFFNFKIPQTKTKPLQTKSNTTPHPTLHIAIMTRGEAQQTKVHYKGKDEDFVIFVDDVKSAKDWKTDKTIPLAQVVSAFKIFVTHK